MFKIDEGDYKNGKQDGFGKFTNANGLKKINFLFLFKMLLGSSYIGQFHAGVPHGKGAFYLNDELIPKTVQFSFFCSSK